MILEKINKKRVQLIKMTPFNQNDNFKILDVNLKNGWVVSRDKTDDHIEIYNVYTKQNEALEDMHCYQAINYIKENYAATVI